MTKSEFAEILTRATEGDHTALGRIFELYMPLIDKHSVVGGRFDEDCKPANRCQELNREKSHFTLCAQKQA